MKTYCVAIVGAMGAVGQQMVKMLEASSIEVGVFKPLDLAENVGELIEFRDSAWAVQEAKEGKFTDVDIVLFAAGARASKILAPIAVAEGAVVIDNSSQWRMDEDVPLVVPEVNAEALREHQGIVANPNCSTIQMVMALKPLYEAFGIKRVVVSTYQSVSGNGLAGIEELREQTQAVLEEEDFSIRAFPHQVAFNVIPQIDDFLENGYTKEEWKLVQETQKILSSDIEVSPTAVRVPVFRGHSESINVEFERSFELEEVFNVYEKTAGIAVVDELDRNEYPMPINSKGKSSVFIGRIRRDFSLKSGINMWVVSDNLTKGAALNTVQIAEKMIQMDLITPKTPSEA
ncbi:MAG: aspartate-semialdehyde dehydrogenase [Sphaerochaeta sp.]|jgi:aspartate-semialdehyde dehydrogenase|nr:aspartate-semialdehyde dehydrogenase [Spirochaetales bacterium]